MISIGNPGVPGKKKPKLTVVIAPLGKSDKPPDDSAPPEDESSETPGPGGSSNPPAGSAPPKPGESLFHDQAQSCSTCEYFNPEGQNGYGECTMHVPEADFSQADPSLSWCKYYEDKNEDDQSQTTDDQDSSSSSPPTA